MDRLSAGASDALFRELADNAPVMIWRSDIHKACDFFNQPWLDFTGRTLEQERGDGWADGVHPDDLARCLAIYVDAFDRRAPFSMDYRLRRHDGAYRWILDNGRPYSRAGDFAGYFGSCIDITERKQLEAELQQALAGRQALVVELRHRMRNNMQLITSMMQIMQRRAEGPARDAITAMDARFAALMLVQNRLYDGPGVGAVDFGGFLRDLATSLRQRLQPRSPAIEVAGSLLLPTDRTVPLGMLLNELLLEALRPGHPRGAGRIAVTLNDDGTGIAVVIEDDAPPQPGADASAELIARALAQQAGMQSVREALPAGNRTCLTGPR